MRLKLHPEAEAEFEDGIRYYNSQQSGLGFCLFKNINDSIQRISEAPRPWPFLERPIRRCLVRTFPYAVLYSVESDFILIIAIMHSHRRPGYWHHRLTS